MSHFWVSGETKQKNYSNRKIYLLQFLTDAARTFELKNSLEFFELQKCVYRENTIS